MALQKNPISINFSQGLQTKVDPYQIPIGQFQALTNTIFTKDGLQQKRNGFGFVIGAPVGAQTLATLNQGLVVFGNTCQSYSADSGQLTNAGVFQPMQLGTTTMVRRATSQTQCDVAVASNGLALSTWLDSDGKSYYQVSDSITGQIVVPAVALPSTAVMSRVFSLGSYFIITFLATVSAASHLQYISVPIINPASPSAAVDISTQAASLTTGYDAAVSGNNLYIALSCSGTTMRVWYLTSSLVLVTPVTVATVTALYVSVTIDISNGVGFPIIWVSFYDSVTTSLTATALNGDLTTNLAKTVVAADSTVLSITSSATNNILTVIYEDSNVYAFTQAPINDESTHIQSHLIMSNTLTLAGVAGTPGVVARGVGLGSKAVVSTKTGSTIFLAAYGQTFQPSYFLMDSSGNVLSRLAYSNGVGYRLNQILPNINQAANGVLQVGYLFADLLQAISKTQGSSLPGVYSQYGINLATFILNGQTSALEIGGSLHASGGMLWQYDGVKIREHGFNVWPEDIGVTGSPTVGSMTAAQGTIFYQITYEWTDAAGQVHRSAPSIPTVFGPIVAAPVSFTGTTTHFFRNITSVSSFTGLQLGQAITGTNIPANSYITGLFPGTSTITMNNIATGTGNVTITPTTLSSAIIYVPTLRQTYKTDNKVRIVIYRWTTTQQAYHRVTSITSPVLNDPTVDYVTFIDSTADVDIVGNDIIYTNGGVIEDICAPGSNAMTLWQSRLFMADAEDKNLIWFSKVVIEATPVEMSDLLTIYIAPTTGAQGSTGPITALSSMDDKLVIFKSDAIYYVTGQGPDNAGNGNFSDPVFITSTVGTSNPQSIVLTPNGIMFESDKGIWILGRDLQTTYIGAAVESYTAGNSVTSALCIPATNQVRFTLSNKTAVMFDYFFNRWSNWTNIPAISSVVYQGAQAYLNSYSQIVAETPGQYLDIGTPVLLSLTTGWINLAGVQGLERFYFAYLLGTYYSPFILDVQLAFDYNPSIAQQIIITPDNYGGVWGSESLWGSGGPWGGAGNAFKARFYPSAQKCESFQLTIQEMYDPSLGAGAGAGLTLSGINMIVGTKRGFRTQNAGRSFG